MNDVELFSAFSDEGQEIYAAEAEKMYDTEIVKSSNKRWKNYDENKKKDILIEGNKIYEDMSLLISKDPESDEVKALLKDGENIWNISGHMPIHSGSSASNGSRQLESTFSPAVTTGKV